MTSLSDVSGSWKVMLVIIKLVINWIENKRVNMVQHVTRVEQREKLEQGLKLAQEARDYVLEVCGLGEKMEMIKTANQKNY